MRLVIARPESNKSEPVPIRFVHAKTIHTPQQKAVAPVDEFASMKRWTATADFSYDAKKARIIKDDEDEIKDIQNVTIDGYLSTFQGTTPFDRQGDYVKAGAFKETLDRFRKNPVMLRDHTNVCECLVGKFFQIEEDGKGLRFTGQLSNAPDVKSIRFKVAEGILCSCSMGGFFHYEADGHGIFKVELFEGSLVPIPANPDARYSVRSLNDMEKRFVKSGGRMTWYDFLKQQTGE
jgi:HK97 family phage prohead protease